jgi:hypothetical protein
VSIVRVTSALRIAAMPARAMSGALAGGAVAVTQDALDLIERAVHAGLARR